MLYKSQGTVGDLHPVLWIHIQYIEFGSGSRILAQFGSGIDIHFEKKILLEIILEKNNFLYKNLFLNYEKIMSEEELFSKCRTVSEWGIYDLNLTSLASIFTDPDPQSS